MISFRLTVEQYDKVRELCIARGLRSVSEMARMGMDMVCQERYQAPQQALETRVAELEELVQTLFLGTKQSKQEAQGIQ